MGGSCETKECGPVNTWDVQTRFCMFLSINFIIFMSAVALLKGLHSEVSEIYGIILQNVLMKYVHM